MSVPNFTSLAGLEVPEKFVVVGMGEIQVAAVSNLKPIVALNHLYASFYAH